MSQPTECDAHQPAPVIWQDGLPTLRSVAVTLRELREGDAGTLFDALGHAAVCEYIAPPPPTADGLRRFIAWTHRERAQQRHVCFGIVPAGAEAPVGMIQIWSLQASNFETAEWGFVLGQRHWGTGVFMSAARLALDFAFQRLGVYRLEARAAIGNARGNGVLANLGATREAILRRNFECRGVYTDHVMWSLLTPEWHSDVPVPLSKGRLRACGSSIGELSNLGTEKTHTTKFCASRRGLTHPPAEVQDQVRV